MADQDQPGSWFMPRLTGGESYRQALHYPALTGPGQPRGIQPANASAIMRRESCRNNAVTTAMLYDFMLVPGGAERLTLHALSQHPDWTLITAFTDDSAFEDSALPLDRLQTLTSLSRRQGWQVLKALHAFERAAPALASFDRLLFSGAYAPAAVNGRDAGGNFYYCHTPPRFAYDLADWYRRAARPWQRPALDWLAARVRDRFSGAMKRMDRVAANSETVRQRLRDHVGLEQVEVIHPPVSTAEWNWLGQEDFFLSTARLEPYKRVDLIIEAFKAMPAQKLVVASGGSQQAKLQQQAAGHPNIRFTGWCSDSEIKRLTGQCRATIYLARDEDFGMSPVESMAAGKPVIGAAEGGLRETVLSGETGLLLDAAVIDDSTSLIDAVGWMSETRAREMREACENRAATFDSAVFDRRLDEFLAGAPLTVGHRGSTDDSPGADR